MSEGHLESNSQDWQLDYPVHSILCLLRNGGFIGARKFAQLRERDQSIRSSPKTCQIRPTPRTRSVYSFITGNVPNSPNSENEITIIRPSPKTCQIRSSTKTKVRSIRPTPKTKFEKELRPPRLFVKEVQSTPKGRPIRSSLITLPNSVNATECLQKIQREFVQATRPQHLGK